MNPMGFIQKIALIFTVWVLSFGLDPLDSLAASSNPKVKKEVPGVETKIRQVPGEGALATPLWKVHWEKARQWVLQKKYPEAVLDFRKALALKSNLDEARLELAQVLIILERWGEAITEMDAVAEHQPLNRKVQKDLADLLSLKKEYRRAIERYQWLLQKDPDNLAIRLSLASDYYQINELEKAMIEWRQVLIRDPQHVEARTNLADVLGATRRLDESILILEGLVKQFPKQPGLKKKLAQTLVAAQRNKEALPYLQELIQQDPGEPEIQLLLAQVLSAGKQYDQSLAYLEAYLKKKPDQSNALLEKARALSYTGNYSQALEIYQRLRKADPNNLDLQREIAEAHFTSGKNKEALSEFEALAKKFPDEYQLHEKVGELHLLNKNYDQAIAPFQKALSIEPENIFAQLNLARAFNFSGEKEKALTLYRSILSKRNDGKIRAEMADLLLDIKQFSEALKIFQQLLEEQPDLWEIRLKLASSLYRQKEFDLASRQLEVLIQQRPNHAGILTLAGYNALDQGDYARAQQAFQKALVLGEDQGNILLRLGEISRLQGRPWKGIVYLDWALTLKPDEQDILSEKAMALIDGGSWSLARRILEPMMQSHPNSFKVQRAWMWLLAALDRRDECEVGWEKLEKGFPLEQELIFQDRADFYLRKKKPTLALTALKAAQIKNPKNLEIQRRIGRLLLQMGQWENAEIFFQNLEKREILLDKVYLVQAKLLIRQGKTDLAREQLWKAMTKSPDSIRIRFRLWQLYAQGKIGVGEAKNIEEALLEFARFQEGGLLELADGYRKIGNWKKAYAHYLELIEKGDDDDVLLSAARVSDSLLREEKADELQEILEDLQKRFPRNQMITRQLIDAYSQGKDYSQAVKAIDGLLRLLDSNDPVLIIKKARLQERWNKHWTSQATYGKLLDPPVDSLLLEKVKALLSKQNQVDDSFLKEMTETGKKALINGFYEETKRKIGLLPLEPNLKKNMEIVLEELKAWALIQRKVFLEKEGKDHLWRDQFPQAIPLLEELKDIDPDNEEVQQDLYRSYRFQN